MSSLIDEIKREEGFRKDIYIDPLQVDKVPPHILEWFENNKDMLNLTIGYGTLMEDISKGMATEMLDFKLKEKISEINSLLYDLGDHKPEVWDALYLMAYQLGSGGVLKFKKMIKAIKAKDYEEAKRQALDSVWARQTPARAEKVSNLFIG